MPSYLISLLEIRLILDPMYCCAWAMFAAWRVGIMFGGQKGLQILLFFEPASDRSPVLRGNGTNAR